MKRGWAACLLVLLLPAVAAALEPLPAAVHVHSDASTGRFSLEELARMAEGEGLGALLLAENYLARLDYGLPPFRALTRVSHEVRSVHGRLDAYFAEVRRLRAAHPRLIVVAGVEVMPHYVWSGSPLALELAVHHTQKNLLVWGLGPEALAALPVVGNTAGGRYTAQSLLDALPALLVVPGVLLIARRRSRRLRVGRATVIVRRRGWLPGLVLCALGVAAVVRGWPFLHGAFSAYEDHGAAPFQLVIDYVERAGGVAAWSFPETRDAGEQAVGPVRVTWVTEPHPDELLRTFRYTAFGAVYADTTRLEQPGGVWDRLLTQYAAGERTRPAWALGESGFHDQGAGKRLGLVQTIFLVRERSEAGLLEALRAGRMYAMQRTAQASLGLGEFSVRAGAVAAVAGETLRTAAGTPLDVRVAVEGSPGAALRVVLVKDGVTAAVWTAPAPLVASHRLESDGRPAVLRVDVRGAGLRLLSNPVFVR